MRREKKWVRNGSGTDDRDRADNEVNFPTKSSHRSISLQNLAPKLIGSEVNMYFLK